MASYLDIFNSKFEAIDNSSKDHLISVIAFFHNKFLNKIHPFADENGRIWRIIMGTILMKHNCHAVFVMITSDKDRFESINKIVECEKVNSDIPLAQFLANGMSAYLEEKVRNQN